MSNETAQIRNLLTPVNALSTIVLKDPSYDKLPEIAKQVEDCVTKIVSELKSIDETHFTIEEISNYLRKSDSMGDALYYLNVQNIKSAQADYCKDCSRFAMCKRLEIDDKQIDEDTIACHEFDEK